MRIPTHFLTDRSTPLTVPDAGAGQGGVLCGHPHHWHGTLSRRGFMQLAAGAAGMALLSRFSWPHRVHAAPMGGPRPIPGTISVPFAPGKFHIFLPEPGNEPSTITDFDGLVGLCEIQGTCTKTPIGGGDGTRYPYHVDMRFMKGRYVGTDGKEAAGAFGFV